LFQIINYLFSIPRKFVSFVDRLFVLESTLLGKVQTFLVFLFNLEMVENYKAKILNLSLDFCCLNFYLIYYEVTSSGILILGISQLGE